MARIDLVDLAHSYGGNDAAAKELENAKADAAKKAEELKAAAEKAKAAAEKEAAALKEEWREVGHEEELRACGEVIADYRERKY